MLILGCVDALCRRAMHSRKCVNIASDKKELKSIVVFVLIYFCLWQQHVTTATNLPCVDLVNSMRRRSMTISVVFHPIKISAVDASGTRYRRLYICRVTGTQTVHTNLVLIGAELAEKQDYSNQIYFELL